MSAHKLNPQYAGYIEYLKSEIGLSLSEEKIALVESRLQKRLRELGIMPQQYLKLVKENTDERNFFFDLATTHKTDWFRESVHFEYLKTIDLSYQDTINIWSAASSTGEEIYSLCMYINENLPDKKLRILGTDISDRCVHDCETGLYKKSLVDGHVPKHLVLKYFHNHHADFYAFRKEKFHGIKFRKFNLIHERLNSKMLFDVIFLRNVLIYFDAKTIETVIMNLLPSLKNQGYLILGLSETITNPARFHLERVQSSIYRYVKK